MRKSMKKLQAVMAPPVVQRGDAKQPGAVGDLRNFQGGSEILRGCIGRSQDQRGQGADRDSLLDGWQKGRRQGTLSQRQPGSRPTPPSSAASWHFLKIILRLMKGDGYESGFLPLVQMQDPVQFSMNKRPITVTEAGHFICGRKSLHPEVLNGASR